MPASGRRLPAVPDRVWPLAVFVVAAVWFLYRNDRPGVWTDEGVTLVVLHRTPTQLWRLWHGNDATMMPYYLLMKALRALSDAVGGPVSDVVLLRSVSGLAMAGAAAALYALVRRRSGVALGLVTALTFVAMPGALRYGQEARPYALMMLASAVTWLAWDVNRERRSWAVRGVYVAAVVFGSLMHLFLLMQLAAQVAAALVADWRHGARHPRDARQTRATLVPLVIGGVIVGLPLAYIALHGHGVPDHMPMSVPKVIDTMAETILNTHLGLAGPLLLVAAVGVVALAVLNRDVLFVLLSWFAIPFVLQAAAGFVQPNTVRLRYWMALATPLGALVGAGVFGVAALLARGLGRALRRDAASPVVSRVTAGLAAAGVALTVVWMVPDNTYIRGNAGHGPVGATAGVMRVLDATPHQPLLLVDSRFNGYAFAGYGLEYVVDNPYATPNPDSSYAWGFQRTPEEFLSALNGHDTVVFAHIVSGGSTPLTLEDTAARLAAAGFRRTRTRHSGHWTIMVYERFSAQNSSATVTPGG